MFQRARRKLEGLLRGHTAFPPPTPPADEATRRRVHGALHDWARRAPERYARCFLHARPLLIQRAERPLFGDLAALGLVERAGPSIVRARVRLFRLYGRLIATDLASHSGPDQVFSLMFEQVYLVRNMDVRPTDHVLELCLGSGVNSLFAADVARSVAGVDLNPRALAFARFNEALNPGRRPLTYWQGSLFEPIEPGRTFDTILVNPPFELVPGDETWFLHSDGGEDGLDVVRRILAETPAYLGPGGRLQIVTWSPATAAGPLLLDLMREALPDRRLTVHALGVQALEAATRTFASSPHYEAWRERLRRRGVEAVQFLFVHAAPCETPGIELLHPAGEIAACHAIADGWLA